MKASNLKREGMAPGELQNGSLLIIRERGNARALDCHEIAGISIAEGPQLQQGKDVEEG